MPKNNNWKFNGWALKAQHKGDKPCANESFLSSPSLLSLFFLSLHLHVFHHNLYKCEKHIRFNVSVEI